MYLLVKASIIVEELAKKKKKFQPVNPEHKDSLRKYLKIKEGKKIPESTLEKVAHDKDETTYRRKQAQLAENMRGWNHAASIKEVVANVKRLLNTKT